MENYQTLVVANVAGGAAIAENGNMLTAAAQDLLSIDRLCVLFQCTPRKIETSAARAHIVPALRLNGVAYFSADQVDELRPMVCR